MPEIITAPRSVSEIVALAQIIDRKSITPAIRSHLQKLLVLMHAWEVAIEFDDRDTAHQAERVLALGTSALFEMIDFTNTKMKGKTILC